MFFVKKVIVPFLICLTALTMAGCGNSPASGTTAEPASAAYTGTQEATASGMGEVKVTITFDKGVVTACDVDAANETPDIGQLAAPTLAKAIVENNTPVVDSVSGATVTSGAVVKAAKACFDAAGIKY